MMQQEIVSLFITNMDDISFRNLEQVKISEYAFADDVVICATHEKQLQKMEATLQKTRVMLIENIERK